MGPRILAFDIEASNLSADFGIVLCVGFKEVGVGAAEVLNILDYRDESGDLIEAEKRLLIEVSSKLIHDGDIWLTHYGTWYDIPFINTRLLYHRLPVLPANHTHIDTWKVSRNRLKLRSNRLVTISDFMGTDEQKNSIKPEQWLRALGGHRESMDYIVEHCRRDCEVLEEVYYRIRPLVLDHPHMGGAKWGACRFCGNQTLVSRGSRLTRTRRYKRLQCTTCGGWDRSDVFEKLGMKVA